MSDRFEGAGQPQIADDQHHREKQNDSGEIDGTNGLTGIDDTESDHQDGTDDGGTRPVDLRAGKFAESKS